VSPEKIIFQVVRKGKGRGSEGGIMWFFMWFDVVHVVASVLSSNERPSAISLSFDARERERHFSGGPRLNINRH
jgi:hypothetical protein